MYREGRGVSQDYAQAYMWFTVSVGRGDTAAAEATRERVTNLMNSNLIAEAERLVRKWLGAHPR
jgi:TPR repeat protein